jgi:hypothetical protein
MGAYARQEQAFVAYLDLGPSRSLSDLARVLQHDPTRKGLRGPSLRTLEGWSVQFRWQQRLADIERKVQLELEHVHVQRVKQYRERLREKGLLLQQHGIEWLDGMNPKNVKAGEAIRAIDAGFKLEALALAEATARIAMEVDDERLERLTDEELENVIRQAREAQRAGAAPQGEARPE